MKVTYKIYQNEDDFDPICDFIYYPDAIPRIGETVFFWDMPDGFEHLKDDIQEVPLKAIAVYHIHNKGDIRIVVKLVVQ